MSGSSLSPPGASGGEVRREVDRRQRRLQLRVEEVGERDPLDAGRRADHAVHGRLVVAAGDELEHLADVDDEGARAWRHVDQLTVPLDLQPADVVLVDEREEPGVAVGADALAGAVGPRWRGGGEVADHLEQHLGWRDRGVERRGRQIEGDGEGAAAACGRAPRAAPSTPSPAGAAREARPATGSGRAGAATPVRPGPRVGRAAHGRCRADRAGRPGRWCARARSGCSPGTAPTARSRSPVARPRARRRSDGPRRPGRRPGGRGCHGRRRRRTRSRGRLGRGRRRRRPRRQMTRRLGTGATSSTGRAGVGNGYGHVSVVQVWPVRQDRINLTPQRTNHDEFGQL